MEFAGLKVLVIGYGNIGSAVYCILKNNGIDVDILSSKNIDTDKTITLNIDGILTLQVKGISCYDPQKKYDVYLFTTPCICYDRYIKMLAPNIEPTNIIVAVPGSLIDKYSYKHKLKNTIIGYDRVPFISRCNGMYTININTKNVPNKIYLGINLNDDEKIITGYAEKFSDMFGGQKNAYCYNSDDINLTNSNPLLHSARLYTLNILKESGVEHEFFYREWTDKASILYKEMDNELEAIRRFSGLGHTDVFTHYGVSSCSDLTSKIRSLKSLENIKIEKKDVSDDRYYTEDIGEKLKFIWEYAKARNIATPTIEKVLRWGLEQIDSSKQLSVSTVTDKDNADYRMLYNSVLCEDTNAIKNIISKNVNSLHVSDFNFFCDVLKENGIRYCLIWGSLLGVVRDGSFIPWDDDFDIFISSDCVAAFEAIFTSNKTISYSYEHRDLFDKIVELKKMTINVSDHNITMHFVNEEHHYYYQAVINNRCSIDILVPRSSYMTIPITKSEYEPIKMICGYPCPNEYDKILRRSYGDDCFDYGYIFNYDVTAKIKIRASQIKNYYNNCVKLSDQKYKSIEAFMRICDALHIDTYIMFGQCVYEYYTGNINSTRLFQFYHTSDIHIDESIVDIIKGYGFNVGSSIPEWLRIYNDDMAIELFKYSFINGSMHVCYDFYSNTAYNKISNAHIEVKLNENPDSTIRMHPDSKHIFIFR